MTYFVHFFPVDLLYLETSQFCQVGAKHLLEYVVFIEFVLSLTADVYLGKGLPNLKSELFDLLLNELRLVDKFGIIFCESIFFLIVIWFELLDLPYELFFELIERILHFLFKKQNIFLAIPNTIINNLKISADYFLEEHIILGNKFIGILQRDDFMGFMFELSEATAHTEYLPLRETVKRKYIIMLYASQLITTTLQ